MNSFKILQIRNNIKDARENPSVFAGSQTKDFLWGILLGPTIICILIIGFFFIIGYTDIFGFQLGFFKFLFWVAFVVSFFVFLFLRKIIGLASSITKRQTKKIIDAVIVEDKER